MLSVEGFNQEMSTLEEVSLLYVSVWLKYLLIYLYFM